MLWRLCNFFDLMFVVELSLFFSDVTDGFGFVIVLTDKFDAVVDVDDTFLFSVALVDEFFF